MIKIRFTVGMLLLSAVLLAAPRNSTEIPAQAPAAPAPPHAQFFAGTLIELDATHIKVTRTLVGHPTESRSFVVTPLTKMNKSVIKLRSHVTVRYKRLPEGDVALEIQPRPVLPRSPKL
jgi:hypothetical protein